MHIEWIDNISWNMWPKQINLLGTVAFFLEEERKDLLKLEDGWQLKPPTPIFPCGNEAVYTIEVACVLESTTGYDKPLALCYKVLMTVLSIRSIATGLVEVLMQNLYL
ncbi:hypothetical protein WOLCODRAFT_19336 [Wolfiporia cocos MD-104 SS10]|uniref:Uncharacterized protein n=1 Tax=Wolfiporia cocos (strain MD-104) TaxID=742152 RepID=A0A2H3K9G4_WOLCO|nr:hypothetical protein WOLCODRAFT_19336 [Wolfiporia cocos MD-104 SS10]